MKSKLLSFLLIGVLIATALPGCAGNNNTGANGAATDNQAASSAQTPVGSAAPADTATPPADAAPADTKAAPAATDTQAAPATADSAADKAPVTLNVWVLSNRDPVDVQTENDFLAANPNITLNRIVNDDPGNNYFQAVAAGNAPDVLNGPSLAQMPRYIAAGIVAPLNDYIKDWSDYQYFLPAMQNPVTDKNGNVYGITSSAGCNQMAYNKKLFDAAGITSLPATWDEVLADARKINDPDNGIAGYGMLVGENPDWFFQYYVWQAGGDLTQKNPDQTVTLTFTDPGVITAINFYKQFYNEKLIQTDLNMGFNDMMQAFAQNKIGMMPFCSAWVGWVASLGLDPNNLVLDLMPAGPNGVRGLGNDYGSYWCINPGSSKDKQDASWEYIKAFSTKDYFYNYMKEQAANGVLSPLVQPRTDVKYSDAGITVDPAMQQFLDDSMNAARDEYYGKSTFSNYVCTAIQNCLLDPNSDPQKEFQDQQDAATREALNDFNKAMTQ